jgi:predicted secreted protein
MSLLWTLSLNKQREKMGEWNEMSSSQNLRHYAITETADIWRLSMKAAVENEIKYPPYHRFSVVKSSIKRGYRLSSFAHGFETWTRPSE